eukprot:m.79500 g.79500  ORF g.79500 m.79500 type:complete len:160 (+) comp36136_c0_seq27:1257-1736(+)
MLSRVRLFQPFSSLVKRTIASRPFTTRTLPLIKPFTKHDRLIPVVHAAADFTYTPGSYTVSSEMKQAFDQDGYIIVRKVLRSEELLKLKEALETDGGIMKYAYGVNDGHGRQSRICLWSHPGKDITGMVARSEKIAGTLEKVWRNFEPISLHGQRLLIN